ncbi:MAG: chemotaxis-specific protein-glutamate methyltransferase CheB [Myxococcota bacterium]
MTARVVVVDDSAVVRRALKAVLGGTPGIEVVGEAADPIEARRVIQRCKPDVLTLDCEMPHLDGISFLKEIMESQPLPIVMVSSLTRKTSPVAFEAMRLGAVSVVSKPFAGYPLPAMLDDVRAAVLAAAQANVRHTKNVSGGERAQSASARLSESTLIVVGSSTGGTVAFERFSRTLPEDSPCVLVAQHLPVGFVSRFAERLGRNLRHEVAVAQGGEVCRPGHIYLAPTEAHLRVRKRGAHFETELHATEKVNHHRPSVDVLMLSAAAAARRAAVGVLLTGMGRDGAQGLLAMKAAGATTMVQDEASCSVFGMPKAALELGAANQAGDPEWLARQAMSAVASG